MHENPKTTKGTLNVRWANCVKNSKGLYTKYLCDSAYLRACSALIKVEQSLKNITLMTKKIQQWNCRILIPIKGYQIRYSNVIL